MSHLRTDKEYKNGRKEEEWCTEMVHFIPCSKCTWQSKAHWKTLVKPDYLPARKLIKWERVNLEGLACSYLFQQIPCPAARVGVPLYRQGRSLLGGVLSNLKIQAHRHPRVLPPIRGSLFTWLTLSYSSTTHC